MTKVQAAKRSWSLSVVALLLCISMLIGTTYAWFTDNVTSAGNIITSGNLDLEMYWTDDPTTGTWHDVEDPAYNKIFDYDKWEPGYTEVRYIKLVNAGNLALNYQLTLTPEGSVGKLAEVINVYAAEGEVELKDRSDLSKLGAMGLLTSVLDGGAAAEGTLLAEGQESLWHDTKETVLTIAMSMITTAGNEYQDESVGDGFSIKALATQCPYEKDSFGSDYDSNAEYPVSLVGKTASAAVKVQDGKVAEAVTISGNGISAIVPAGVAVKDGTEKLTVKITPLKSTTTDITVVNNEILIPVDVHIEGVAEGNTVPIIVDLGEILPKYLNMGNYALIHVEDGVNNTMTFVNDKADLNAHNQFTYEPLTGAVTVSMASFSEVALMADTSNPWNGIYNYEWYKASETSFTICNADQLAGMGKIVGGMADGIDKDTFSGDTIKLISDINLNGGRATVDGKTKVFYPIGYYNKVNGEVSGIYDRTDATVEGKTGVSSNVSSFSGTFDGNGHTISNFYQNTWEMFGDYNDGYSGTPNYYKDAMGLFGYVNGGTVKNLTVDNFSSDGEFTPTGVIAAYAVNSTFENIAITNCTPRVYNTGNGGIVGIGGNSDDPDTYKLTFNNITIDNTNKITALWGSWDVACGGLVGMFRGDGHVHMTNCHVAAQIDVYNDVCGNYQYYWYRYSGMMVGTNKNMTTDANGYTVPETDKFHAENCTVHFGKWNDYYYCELVANSLASYTHDHQFSRLTEISSLDEIKSGDTWTKTGNFLLISGDTKTCYHIVNKDGVLTQHNHKDAGEETVNGEKVLKEDKQIVYLPFNQLFTGYGWGVKHIPVYNGANYAFEGITILDREVADSHVKFEKADTAKDSYTTGATVTIGELFKAAVIEDEKLSIKGDKVQVTVSPKVGTDSTVVATYTANTTDWTQGTLTFSGTGAATVIITDYYYCTPTTLSINVTERVAAEKFETKFTGDFLYRVGNQNTVKLGSLFEAVDDAEIGTVDVTIANIAGTTSGTYTRNAIWTDGTIQFSGTGKVKVTIKDDDTYCVPTELELQVVEATNVTTATNATSRNVVLLNDCGFSSLEVSGGYALYGNGFTMTCASDSYALDMGYSFVNLDNGTLDNVQIVCPNFDYAALYKENLTSDDNRSYTDSSGKTRYYNAKSGVMVSGSSQILNSRISGGRAAVNVSSGNVLIDNSRLELGAVASLLVGAANKLTLRDITLVQKPAASTYDSSKSLMGFSTLFICSENGDAAPVTLEGDLVQYAWVDEDDIQYVPTAGQSIVQSVLEKTEYLHDIDGDGTNESLNLGFAYMPASLASPVNTTTITDNRTNKDAIPYDYAEVSIISGKTYVYSYKNTNGTDGSFKTESAYVPNRYSDIVDVTYSDTSEGVAFGKSYGTDGWIYELNVDSGYKLDFSKLSMLINGETVTDFKVDDNPKPTSPITVTAGGTTYALTTTVNGVEYTATFKVIGVETSKESPSLVGTPSYGAGFGVANKYGGDWSAAAPVLDGITIKYWSVADSEYKEFALSSITFASTGKQNGTNNYWEYTHTNNDFTLKVTNTAPIHSNSGTYGMPVAGKDGKLYFTIASTGGFVKSTTTSRSITISYEFTDNNGGDTLKFSNTWNIAQDETNQYNYTSFVEDGTLTKLEESSGSSPGTCLAEGTLITLADGSKKAIEDLRKGDSVMAFDHLTGKVTNNDVIIVVRTQSDFYKNTFVFDNGTELATINEHGIYDLDLQKYVNIDHENYADYIGHNFVAIDPNGKIGTKKLVNVVSEWMSGYKYDIVTDQTLNYVAEDTLSVTHVLVDIINSFEFDENMLFDQAKMQADIEKYGLYSYDEWKEYCDISVYEEYNIPVMKVGVSKGLYTKEYIISLINTYVLDESVQIID